MEFIKECVAKIGDYVKSTDDYEIYLKALDAYNSDGELQAMLREFTHLRDELYHERDAEKIDKNKVLTLQKDMQTLYSKIMDNENMRLYTEARNAFDEYIEKIHTLLNAQIYGEEESGCTGGCATCAGCH